VRIAIDIDSTLHHYWPEFAAAARRRFGVELPYDEQPWEIDRLRPEQVEACVRETHSDERILAAEPYPGAVETVRAWHEAGHFIHITSHRRPDAHDVTAAWLRRIGIPYDDLHCSDDKISRCVELGIDLLIDDSPVNLTRAADAGLRTATLAHPWNRDVCEEEDVVCAEDWGALRGRLEPVLA
jgi:hypothetical protein